jgi:hypothetical protein
VLSQLLISTVDDRLFFRVQDDARLQI